MTNSPSRLPFVSLRIKLVVAFTLLFSLTFGAASYWTYHLEVEDMLANMRSELQATLQGALLGMDGDRLAALARDGLPNAAGFSDDPRYQAELDWFAHVQSIEPRAWLYSYVRGQAENEVIFIGDLWARFDPSRAATFQEPFEDERMTLGLEQLTFEAEPYCDKWGCWVSVYAPVTDAAGQKVGGLGLDFEASRVTALQQRILRNIILAFIITYAAGVLLVYFLAGWFSRPLVRLAGLAGQIAEGRYDLDFAHLRPDFVGDEIATLAAAFEWMAGKVFQREQSLKQQVEALKIEIDEVKRQRAVSEIVETDFFRELAEKAEGMRARRKG